MTLSITQYDRTVTITTPDEDLDIAGTVEQLKALLLAIGYHPDNIAEAFGDAIPTGETK